MRNRPEYDMKLIGRNLKRLRESKRLSVDEVRKYLCLGSVQAVYKYEKGVSCPPADTMFALMELYEADLEDIVGGHGTEQPAFAAVLELPDAFSSDAAVRHQTRRLIRYCKSYMEHIRRAAYKYPIISAPQTNTLICLIRS